MERDSSLQGCPRAPSLLLRLYPSQPLLTLRDLLIRLSQASPQANSLCDTLAKAYDPNEYVRGLLSSTWCLVGPGAPDLGPDFGLAQFSSQEQVRKQSTREMSARNSIPLVRMASYVQHCACRFAPGITDLIQ